MRESSANTWLKAKDVEVTGKRSVPANQCFNLYLFLNLVKELVAMTLHGFRMNLAALKISSFRLLLHHWME